MDRRACHCLLLCKRDGQSGGSAGGGTRTLTRIPSTDFRTVYGFRRPAVRRRVCGLDYPFTVPRISGVRCCPSSLYTFPAGMFRPGLARDCHYRFPRIWAVLHRRFPGEHSSCCLKSVASAIPPRPHFRYVMEAYHKAAKADLQSMVRADGHRRCTIALRTVTLRHLVRYRAPGSGAPVALACGASAS